MYLNYIIELMFDCYCSNRLALNDTPLSLSIKRKGNEVNENMLR